MAPETQNQHVFAQDQGGYGFEPRRRGLRSSRKRLIAIILIVAGVLALIFAAISILGKKSTQEMSVIPSPTPLSAQEPTPIPSPTPETVSLSSYKIQILNGSGIAGEAGKVASLLVKAGFAKADTGNASSYDFTKTVVSTKEDIPSDVYSTIEQALAGYKVSKGDPLSKAAKYDIVITVGGNGAKKTTSQPTTSSTGSASSSAQ